jgi:hypothetical protein
VLTSRRAGGLSATRSAARAGVAVTLPAGALAAVMTVITLMTWTPAHAQDQRVAGGVSNTSCVGGFTTFNCVTRWGPAGDPYVRVVPRPVDEAEKARLVARDRKWLERCSPIVERDRYGVGRLRYAAPGCEFGVSDD